MDPASSTSIPPDKFPFQGKKTPPPAYKKSEDPKDDLLKTATNKRQEPQEKIPSNKIPPVSADSSSKIVQHAVNTVRNHQKLGQKFQRAQMKTKERSDVKIGSGRQSLTSPKEAGTKAYLKTLAEVMANPQSKSSRPEEILLELGNSREFLIGRDKGKSDFPLHLYMGQLSKKGNVLQVIDFKINDEGKIIRSSAPIERPLIFNSMDEFIQQLGKERLDREKGEGLSPIDIILIEGKIQTEFTLNLLKGVKDNKEITKILNIDPKLTTDEKLRAINIARKKLFLDLHPDKYKGKEKEAINEVFKQVDNTLEKLKASLEKNVLEDRERQNEVNLAEEMLKKQDPTIKTQFNAKWNGKLAPYELYAQQRGENIHYYYRKVDRDEDGGTPTNLTTAAQVKAAIALRQSDYYLILPKIKIGQVYIFSYEIYTIPDPGSNSSKVKLERVFCFQFNHKGDREPTQGSIVLNPDGTLSARLFKMGSIEDHPNRQVEVEDNNFIEFDGKTKFNTAEDLLAALDKKYPKE